MPTCQECGAALPPDRTCQSIFDEFLVLEFTDPAYGAVHFLTVACFMIQHGRYSDEGLTWIHEKLREYLEEGHPIEHIRQNAQKETQNHQRSWKVTRSADAPQLPRIAWSMTIADVAAAYHDADSYRAQIEQWARRTLADMKVPGK